MLKTSLAGLLAHKLRLVLTSMAITLGVGFIAGTFVLTDTMQSGYDQKFAASAGKVSVAVLPPRNSGEPLPAALLAKVRSLPGVAEVQGTVRGTAALIGKDGKAYGDTPTVGFSVPAGRLARTEVTQGRAPAAATEAVLDKTTAKRTGYGVGDTIRVLDHKGTSHDFQVTGVVDSGLDVDLGFRGGVGFDALTAARMTGEKGFTELDVAAASGVGATALRGTVAGAVGKGYDTLTGEQLGVKLAKAAGADTKVIKTGLLIFGLVSLLVSALVIYNTFSILVAQRMRELALLRCVGATRRQVFTGVLTESAVVGLIGSLIGLVVGLGLGTGALAVFNALGADLPSGGATLAPRTVLVALLVGVVVTVLSALLPARAATRVAPIAALRSEPEPGTGRFRLGWPRILCAVVFGGLGLVLVVLGSLVMKHGENAMLVVAAGGCLTFLTVIALMPALVRPLARIVGALPARWSGVPGQLAMENSRRAPRRTATTTIALTVGVGLMTLFSVVGASGKATTAHEIDKSFPVDYTLESQGGGDQLVPRELAGRLRAQPQIAAVTEVRGHDATIAGQPGYVGTITQSSIGTVFTPPVKSGSLNDLRPGTVALSEDEAKNSNLRVGQQVSLKAKKGVVRLTVAVVFAGGSLLPPVLLTETDFDHQFAGQPDTTIYVNTKKGVDQAQARTAVENTAKPYAMVKVRSAVAVKEQFNQSIDTLLLIFGGLLGLAIIIALFGIANTLTLSVVERTRESALLRALGLTKGQLRRMLSVEALIMAVIGALTGVILGCVFGWAGTRSMSGSPQFVLPYLQITGFVALAGLAGVLAAVLPARRAAKASIVESLSS